MRLASNVLWGPKLGEEGERDIHSERERQIMVGRRTKGGLEIEICTTEQSKWGWEVGWVSIQIFPGHVNREDRATERECECEWVSPQCSCMPVLHSVGTEMPLSDTNELSATSFSLPK